MHRLLLVLVGCATLAYADYDNFPVKSINIASAPSISFYTTYPLGGTGQITLEDAHPVYGFECSGGGYVFCGKGLEAEGSSNNEAFAVKFTSTGAYQWGWRSNVAGMDAANACMQLPNGGDVLVIGYRLVGTVMKRSITKLAIATGTEAWTATDFGDADGSHGAWEGIDLTSDGSDAVLGGFTAKETSEEMAFRSYGNCGGSAVVVKLPVTALTASTAPTSASLTWSTTITGRMSAKAVRPFANGEIAVMAWTDAGSDADAATNTAIAKLSAAGALTWGPINVGVRHGEGTDIQVTETDIFMTGHNDCDTAVTGSGLCGKLTKIGGSDGAVAWSKVYSSCGVPNACGHVVIKNECWGLQMMSDGGAVIACGTGIENCNGMTGTMLSDCQGDRAITGDTRTGAYPRAAAVWQSMVVRTDAAGNVLWQRVDQYRGTGDVALGQSGWEAASSASEYVAQTSDGGLIFINDEGNGIGVMKLGGSGGGGGGGGTSSGGTSSGGGGGTSSGGGLDSGAIAGIAIGGSLVVIGLVIAVFCLISKRHASGGKASKDAEMTAIPTPSAA